MAVVFDSTMYVVTGVVYVSGLGDARPTAPDDVESAFEGQVNGLLGAAVPAELAVDVALQSGYFGMRVKVLDAPPSDEPGWEDVVEASFTPLDPDVVFMNFDSDSLLEMTLEPRAYRVRMCARNMDAADEKRIVIDEDEPLVDYYQVSFWPAPKQPDAVLRCGSRLAAKKHATRGR